MERDFLGISGKDSAVKEETRGSCKDAGILGSSAVQWPFSNNITALQQFLSFKAAQEEKPKKIVFDKLSSGFQRLSTLDSFDTDHRSNPVLVSQRSFGIDREGIHQFQLPGYSTQDTDPFGASGHHSNDMRTFPVVSHNSIPITTRIPLFKVNGSANGPNPAVTSLMQQQQPFSGGPAAAPPAVSLMAGAFAPRNITKPLATTAQLTIFYAGAVNVYDDVPLEKAQEIMFWAGNALNATSNAGNIRAQTPVSTPIEVEGNEAINKNQTQTQTQTQTNVMQPCSVLSNPISTTSHSGAQSGSGSSATDDLNGAKAIESLAPKGQHEPPKSIVTASGSSGVTLMPRAVPQARKASLARFLEKRKERVTNAAPYPSPHKPFESNVGFNDKSMTTESAHSSSREQSWCLGTPKNSTDSSNCLSTKLEI